jgi:hypothetical protein
MAKDTAAIRHRISDLARLPRLAVLGIAVIAVGVLADAIVHSLGVVTAGTLAALVVQQHLAHAVVLLGMVITLAGVVVDGARGSGRLARPGRETSHAVR